LDKREKTVKLKKLFVLLILFLFVPLTLLSYQEELPLLSLSVRDYPEYSRIIIQAPSPLESTIEKNGAYIIIKVETEEEFRVRRRRIENKFVKSLDWSKGVGYYAVVAKAEHSNFNYDSFNLDDPPQLVIDIHPKEKEREEMTRPERDESLTTRARRREQVSLFQGERTVVIDPGHGGLESGARGKFGALEKNITLAIGRRLRSIIERNLAFRVVLTREEDVFKPLEERAAIANNNKAYLFISLHTNSSNRKNARGPETYFLNLNATDEEARRLAYLENKSSELEERIENQKEDEIKMILWDMAQASYLKQSSQLAENIQEELNSLLKTRNRGIKQAPFRVLTGVACPAVLIEVAFISNPDEEKQLISDEFQESVAEAIYQGLMKFLRSNSQE